ncbi:hypothetical protein E4T56_gene16137 [Termitomyces sp. T112]|nr:hypothetical protein E4T56_gene16137 [Termitomyces sp. T112]
MRLMFTPIRLSIYSFTSNFSNHGPSKLSSQCAATGNGITLLATCWFDSHRRSTSLDITSLPEVRTKAFSPILRRASARGSITVSLASQSSWLIINTAGHGTLLSWNIYQQKWWQL